MSGKLGDARLFLSPNRYKKNAGHPDAYLYVATGWKPSEGEDVKKEQPKGVDPWKS